MNCRKDELEGIREQARIGLGNLTKEVQGREGRTLPLIGGTEYTEKHVKISEDFEILRKQAV